MHPLQSLLATLALVALAAVARFPRLGETPGWDGDEGYNVEIAWQLLHGRAQAFALDQSFVQHPVLFYALLAPLLGIFGRELWVARALAAAAGCLTAGLLYLAMARATTARAAAFAGLAFALAPFVVTYNRLAYTYNLLALWVAATLLCVTLWEETRARRWLVLATCAAALGWLTDQPGLALPVFVALRAWPRRGIALAVLAGGVLPGTILAAGMLLAGPESALQDWRQSVWRVTSGDAALSPARAVATRVALWLINYLHLLRAEWWWPAAVAGLFCVAPLAGRRRLLSLAVLLVGPVFALRELEPFFRTGVPLLVPGCAGLGALLDVGVRKVYETVGPRRFPRGRAWAALMTALVVVLPLGLEAARTAGGVATRLEPRFDWALARDHASARAAAAYVSSQSGEEDVVIVSPHVSWLYRGRVTDFFQSLAWSGEPVAFYPAGMSHSRFRFDPSPEAATFAVVDDFWRRWSEASAPLATLTSEVEGWPEVQRAGEYSVRRNPQR